MMQSLQRYQRGISGDEVVVSLPEAAPKSCRDTHDSAESEGAKGLDVNCMVWKVMPLLDSRCPPHVDI